MPRAGGGDAQSVERIDNAADADERVLDHLARLGCNATTPCTSTHFLYTLARGGADAIAKALRRDGWRTTVESCEDETWLVAATQVGTLDAPSVRSRRKDFEALAAAHGGVYDGWQATAI
jgi:hypothetical protein